jgi:hypothetical protein
MVLTRREYNRLLWRQAASGMGLWAHVGFVAVALAVAGVRYLRTQSFQAELAPNIGIPLAVVVALEVVWLFLRRFLFAPYEVHLQQQTSGGGRDSEIEELKQQLNKLPRPRLLLTYTVESLKGLEDEVSNPPILLHNDGNAAAVEASIDSLQLTPLIKVNFVPVQQIAGQDTAVIAPRVEIRTASGGWELEHNEKHFGLAIQRAHAELAHRNVKTQGGSRRWTMTVRYYDSGGTPYTQDYELLLHVPTMKAWTVFVPPAAAAEISSKP